MEQHLVALGEPSSFQVRVKNALASAGIISLASLFYFSIGHHQQKELAAIYGARHFAFTGAQFFMVAVLAYAALLTIYYFAERDPGVSKSLRFWQILATAARAPSALKKSWLSSEDRVALLSTLLKAFFAPLMVMWFLGLVAAVAGDVMTLAAAPSFAGLRDMFDRFGFWFLMRWVLLIDLATFTMGYLLELPSLDNRIRSVDPTLLGWGVTLMCYPPMNTVTTRIIGSQVVDFPQFESTAVHIGLNLLMITLMGIFAWASVALGFKASNLTHRGIIDKGPYRFVRHPAYTCKNMAWWIGSSPIVIAAFQQSFTSGLLSLGSVAGWSMIYFLRAITEEDHLHRVDGEYAAYAAKVRYRFIPGVI
jgi:protein-S-isoprenylcysteine O-methyltransferase Ste14